MFCRAKFWGLKRVYICCSCTYKENNSLTFVSEFPFFCSLSRLLATTFSPRASINYFSSFFPLWLHDEVLVPPFFLGFFLHSSLCFVSCISISKLYILILKLQYDDQRYIYYLMMINLFFKKKSSILTFQMKNICFMLEQDALRRKL